MAAKNDFKDLLKAETTAKKQCVNRPRLLVLIVALICQEIQKIDRIEFHEEGIFRMVIATYDIRLD